MADAPLSIPGADGAAASRAAPAVAPPRALPPPTPPTSSGSLTAAELAATASITLAQAEAEIAKHDHDGDGTISFDEAQRIVVERTPRIEACDLIEVIFDPTAGEQLNVELTIDDHGRVLIAALKRDNVAALAPGNQLMSVDGARLPHATSLAPVARLIREATGPVTLLFRTIWRDSPAAYVSATGTEYECAIILLVVTPPPSPRFYPITTAQRPFSPPQHLAGTVRSSNAARSSR